MRNRSRRRVSPIAELDVTAFINLMVVLVAFFLSSVTYFQFNSLELNIPPVTEGEVNPGTTLNLEIIIRKDALEVGDRNVGLIRRFNNKSGKYDFKGLNEILRQLKARYPDKSDATILAEANTPYEILIKTMDATHTFAIATAGKVIQYELFPDLSIGDAPEATLSGATQ